MFFRFLICTLFIFLLIPHTELAAESLIDAIKSNQPEKAARMIAAGVDLSEADSDGNTPLIVAALRNSNLVKLLLENGADPSFMNPQGFTVLHLLAGRMYIPDEPMYASYREGYYKSARLILETGIDVERPTSRGWTPLMLAARAGADDMIRMLVEAGANTETPNESAQTALHFAAASLRPSSVRALIEAGANLNAKDNEGRTALIICSEHQNDPILSAQVARILLMSKARTDLQDDSGQTALMVAVHNGNRRMEKLLTDAGAGQSEVNRMRLFAAVKSDDLAEVDSILETTNPDTRDDQNRTPLMIAIIERNSEMVDFLLQHGADPNAEDMNNQTPIIHASNFQQGRPSLRILKQLIDSGSKVNAKDSDGNTALAFAIETFFGEGKIAIKTLLDAKADPNTTYFKQPILFSAIRKREPVVVDFLLRARANPNVEYEKTTPLAIAVQTQQPQMISLLMKYQALDVAVMQQANEILRGYEERLKQIEKRISGNLPNVEMVLRRSSCDGSCPAYTVKIHSDGEVEYQGEKNVTLTGSHRSKIEPHKIREILRRAHVSGFFEAENSNAITPSDSGDSIITINVDGNSQTLTSRDADLDSLARTIDLLTETHQWTSATPNWILAHSSDGSTLSSENLIRAVNAGEIKIVEALLKAGCDPNTFDESGESILVLSARNGKLPIIELLFKYGAYPDERALIAAASKDDLKTLEYLLNHGLSAHGLSLHSLARDASAEVIDLLARASAGLNSTDEFGNTPLILAAGYRNYDMVQALLRRRIDPNVANQDGLTPLLAAMSEWEYPYSRWFANNRDPVEIADLLLRAGANPNSTHRKNGRSALSISISRRDYLLTRLLRKAGANPDLANLNGITPLMIVSQQEFSEILSLLQE